MSMGLLISAVFSSSEAAVGTLPLLLIPQITFGGLIVKVKEMGLVAKGLSYLMVIRFSFEATIKTGEQLTRPARYGSQRDAMPISGFLYDLGFRTSSADDMGLSLSILCGLLMLFFITMTGAAWWFTRRLIEKAQE